MCWKYGKVWTVDGGESGESEEMWRELDGKEKNVKGRSDREIYERNPGGGGGVVNVYQETV